MPRARPRYHQPPTHRQRTPSPSPIPKPTPTPTPRQPRLNAKLLTGTFLIFLSLLIFLATIKDLPSRTPWPAYKPLPSASTCLGTWAFICGVAEISPKFEALVRNWGLGGATMVAAAVAFGVLRAQWYWCVLFVLGAAFGGMLLGVFVTPEKLLVKWKEEMRAEAENLAYAERQMGR
ncbi:hypothetical protein VF21_05835 [Pseudogymnoascus sp. 05NY08]|nr:hypothetical protein VF21_05835 [Pseudogymnoascus sp. 05NY08]